MSSLHRRVVLVILATAFGIVTFVSLRADYEQVVMMPTRGEGLTDSASAYRAGAPFLSRSAPDGSALVDAAQSDDPGLYIVGTALAGVLDGDPVTVWSQFVHVVLGLTVAGSIWALGHRLASIPATVVLGFAYLRVALAVGWSDVYWAPAFAVMLILPVGLWLNDARTEHGKSLVIVLALVATALGVASSVRSLAGEGGLLVLLAFIAAQRRTVVMRCILAVGVVLVFWVGSRGYPDLVRAVRDAHSSEQVETADIDAHPTWHSIFIGLGFDENEWGIRYRDEYALAAVVEEDPDIRFMGPGYEQTLQEIVWDLVSDEPRFVFEQTMRKAAVTFGRESAALALLMILFASFTWIGEPSRKRILLASMAVGPSAALAVVSGIMVVPSTRYQYGWSAALALLLAFAFASVLSDRSAWAAWSDRDLGMQSHGHVRLAAGLVVAIMLVLPLRELGQSAWRGHDEWNADAMIDVRELCLDACQDVSSSG